MFFERCCPGCGQPARTFCGDCWPDAAPISVDVAGLDALAAVASYDDQVAAVVIAAKNGGRRDILRVLARSLAARSVALRSAGCEFDCVTWVPASPSQRQARGFDQGRVLARSTARALGIPHRRFLTRRGDAQKGGSRSIRLAGPDVRATSSTPPRLLLVDDVVTTGGSMSTSAAALRAAGARHVSGIALAVVARSQA